MCEACDVQDSREGASAKSEGGPSSAWVEEAVSPPRWMLGRHSALVYRIGLELLLGDWKLR